MARARNITGVAHQRRQHHFLDPVFQQPGRRSLGFWPGTDIPRLDDVTTSSGGSASINYNLSGGVAVGAFVTALATNESTGDTSAFSNAIAAQAASVAFSMANYTVASTAGTAVIDVVRTGNLNVAVSVNYATSNGSAIAGQDYTASPAR